MRNLSDTIARLSALQQRSGGITLDGGPDRLTDLRGFGSNPGSLRARIYAPGNLVENAPLVVVLHGCTQTAAGYDRGSGWSRLADEEGFAVLFPEQVRQNNPNLCFNWFAPADVTRGSGEVSSIAQMIDAAIIQHGLDSRRVFITGLSAGGAMAAAMLATYPEKFAGGAIIAGLPFACAATIPEAFDRMRGHGLPTPQALRVSLAAASRHKGSWPRLAIWHGDADATVASANADAIAGQWSEALGVGEAEAEMLGPHRRLAWRDASGDVVMESIRIAGMGHGAPIDPRIDGSTPAPFMLDAGISSTLEIARFWGITERTQLEKIPEPDIASTPIFPTNNTANRWPRPQMQAGAPATDGITKTIEDALRAAGLMR